MTFVRTTLRSLLAAILLTPQISIAEDTEIAQRLFEEAIEKRELGDVFRAIELFESILDTAPQLNRARLELAVAYHQVSRYEEAMRQFKLVLDDPDTPENVRLSILAYLGQVNSDQNQPEGSHHASYYIRTGILNNSNLNASQATNSTINITNPGEISSMGIELAASASHRYTKRDKLNIAGTTVNFEWQSAASLTNNTYSKDSDFNLNLISLNTGPAFISPGRWRGTIMMRLDHVILGADTLGSFASLAPSITFDLGRFRSVIVEGSFMTNSYDDPQNAGFDGNQTMLGAGYTTFLPENAVGFEAGLRLHMNNADDEQHAFDMTEIYAGSFLTLDDHASLYFKYHNRQYDYEALNTSVNLIRDESEHQITFGYNYDIPKGTLEGWTLNAEFSSVDSDSNANSLDYDRQIIAVKLSTSIQ